MEPFHAVVLTVSLFVLTFLIPARICLWWCKPASHQDAGRESSPARASPRETPLFRLGLFGLATLITQCEAVFSLIKIVGGAYLLWFARNSIRHRATPQMSTLQTPIAAPWTIFFRRGLMTDLSIRKPYCFYQYFSVTLSAETPTWARLMAGPELCCHPLSGVFFSAEPFRSPQSAALMGEYSALPAVLSAPLSGCLRSDFSMKA